MLVFQKLSAIDCPLTQRLMIVLKLIIEFLSSLPTVCRTQIELELSHVCR